MILNKASWIFAKKVLLAFTRRNKSIERSYIRHSAAFGPQDPLLSDMDATFFVKAADLSALLTARKKIVEDLSKDRMLSCFVRDAIVLPSTQNAYDLCKKYYPFRSAYPFETWRSPEDSPSLGMTSMERRLPLDHVPENSLFHYFFPVARGKKTPHNREREFLLRKVQKDSALVGMASVPDRKISFYAALLFEIDLWSSFYQSLQFSAQKGRLILRSRLKYEYPGLLACWHSRGRTLKKGRAISSVWIYPGGINEDAPHVVVNLDSHVAEKECEEAITAVVKLFQRSRCSLVFGSEATMIG
ncbi:MAG: hypothetical protein HQL21_03335, partial [Candidatus Omnitrophica bacterium]|nr:hypothetical protein [Candidatus Omnitrophota bacterium]